MEEVENNPNYLSAEQIRDETKSFQESQTKPLQLQNEIDSIRTHQDFLGPERYV
jgi:hypothetical protein